MISSMLCMETHPNRTKLQHSQQKDASHCESIRKMKKLSIRSTTTDSCKVRSQKSSVLYDNQEAEQTTSTMSGNTCRVQLQDTALQEKEQHLNRCVKQKIRLHERRQQSEMTSSTNSEQQ